MGSDSINNGIDVDRARYERMNRLNPPQYAPGQEPQGSKREPVSVSRLFGDGDKITDNTPQEVRTAEEQEEYDYVFDDASSEDVRLT